MDINGHVNNTIYFRYFENARVQIFDELFQDLKQHSVRPVLAYTNCHFVKPIAYPDKVIVGTRVRSLGKTSVVLEHLIHSKNGGVAAHGESVIVIYDFAAKSKISIPRDLKEKLLMGMA